MTTDLAGFGITISLPDSWDGRIRYRGATPRVAGPLADPGTAATTTTVPPAPADARRPWWNDSGGEPDAPGSRSNPIVHVANFALPADRGDYGSGAVDIMGSQHLLMVLTEFGPESVGTPLFAPVGLPRTLEPGAFSPNALQRRLPNQLGYQHFFTHAGRAFSLFVVLGGARNASTLCNEGSGVLTNTRIEST